MKKYKRSGPLPVLLVAWRRPLSKTTECLLLNSHRHRHHRRHMQERFRVWHGKTGHITDGIIRVAEEQQGVQVDGGDDIRAEVHMSRRQRFS